MRCDFESSDQPLDHFVALASFVLQHIFSYQILYTSLTNKPITNPTCTDPSLTAKASQISAPTQQTLVLAQSLGHRCHVSKTFQRHLLSRAFHLHLLRWGLRRTLCGQRRCGHHRWIRGEGFIAIGR